MIVAAGRCATHAEIVRVRTLLATVRGGRYSHEHVFAHTNRAAA